MMDVVPNSDLYDFVESLDNENNDDIKDVKSITQPADVADVTVGVWRLWHRITDVVNDWSQQVFDAESLHKRSESFHTSLEGSIYRLELDGFLSTFELSDLRATKDKFVRLLHLLSSYSIGNHRTSNKKDIISLLLDLYVLKKLPAETFIECCTYL